MSESEFTRFEDFQTREIANKTRNKKKGIIMPSEAGQFGYKTLFAHHFLYLKM